jgi:hypothetical protein
MARTTNTDAHTCAITLAEIADHLGIGGTNTATGADLVRRRAERDGYAVTSDWKGQDALAYADARAFVADWRAEADKHSAQDKAYRDYVDDRRRQAEAKIRQEAAARRQEEKERLAQSAARGREELKAERAKIAAEQERDQEKWHGRPVSFEAFSAGKR